MSEIKYCETHKRHFSTLYGCHSCPDEKNQLIAQLKETVVKLQQDVLLWKDAWFDQRRATGEVAWQEKPKGY